MLPDLNENLFNLKNNNEFITIILNVKPKPIQRIPNINNYTNKYYHRAFLPLNIPVSILNWNGIEYLVDLNEIRIFDDTKFFKFVGRIINFFYLKNNFFFMNHWVFRTISTLIHLARMKRLLLLQSSLQAIFCSLLIFIEDIVKNSIPASFRNSLGNKCFCYPGG